MPEWFVNLIRNLYGPEIADRTIARYWADLERAEATDPHGCLNEAYWARA